MSSYGNPDQKVEHKVEITEEKIAIPNRCFCPIHLGLMQDPVSIVVYTDPITKKNYSSTYDRSSLTEHLKTSNIDPLLKKPFKKPHIIVEALHLKEECEEWQKKLDAAEQKTKSEKEAQESPNEANPLEPASPQNYGALQDEDDVPPIQAMPGEQGDILMPGLNLAAPLLPVNGAGNVGINGAQQPNPCCSRETKMAIAMTGWLTGTGLVTCITAGWIPCPSFSCCEPDFSPQPLQWIFSKPAYPNSPTDDPDYIFILHNPNPDEIVVASVQFNSNGFVRKLFSPEGPNPLFPKDAKFEQHYDEANQLWTITITASDSNLIHIPGNGDATLNATVSPDSMAPLPTAMPPTSVFANKQKVNIQGLSNTPDPTPGIISDASIETDTFYDLRNNHHFELSSLTNAPINRVTYRVDVDQKGNVKSIDRDIDAAQLHKVPRITQQHPRVINSALKFGQATPGFANNIWANIANNTDSATNFAYQFGDALQEIRSKTGIIDWRWGNGVDNTPVAKDYVELIKLVKRLNGEMNVEFTVPGTPAAVKDLCLDLQSLTSDVNKVWILPRGSSNGTAGFSAPFTAYEDMRIILAEAAFFDKQKGILIPSECQVVYVTSMGSNYGYGQPIDNSRTPDDIDYACAYSGGTLCLDGVTLPPDFKCIDQTTFVPEARASWCYSAERNLVASCSSPGSIRALVQNLNADISVSITDATRDLPPEHPNSMTQVLYRARQSRLNAEATSVTVHENAATNCTQSVSQNLENTDAADQKAIQQKVELPKELQTQMFEAATRGALNAVVIQGVLNSFLATRNYSKEKKFFIQQGLQSLLIIYQLGPGLMNTARAFVSPVIVKILMKIGFTQETANAISYGATTAAAVCSSPLTTLPVLAASTIASSMTQGILDARVGNALIKVLTKIPNYFVDSRPVQYVANKMDAVYQSAANSRAATVVSNAVNKVTTSLSECQLGKTVSKATHSVILSCPIQTAAGCAFFVADKFNKANKGLTNATSALVNGTERAVKWATPKPLANATTALANGAKRVARWACASKPIPVPQIVQSKSVSRSPAAPFVITQVKVNVKGFIPRRFI